MHFLRRSERVFERVSPSLVVVVISAYFSCFSHNCDTNAPPLCSTECQVQAFCRVFAFSSHFALIPFSEPRQLLGQPLPVRLCDKFCCAAKLSCVTATAKVSLHTFCVWLVTWLIHFVCAAAFLAARVQMRTSIWVCCSLLTVLAAVFSCFLTIDVRLQRRSTSLVSLRPSTLACCCPSELAFVCVSSLCLYSANDTILGYQGVIGGRIIRRVVLEAVNDVNRSALSQTAIAKRCCCFVVRQGPIDLAQD